MCSKPTRYSANSEWGTPGQRQGNAISIGLASACLRFSAILPGQRQGQRQGNVHWERRGNVRATSGQRQA